MAYAFTEAFVTPDHRMKKPREELAPRRLKVVAALALASIAACRQQQTGPTSRPAPTVTVAHPVKHSVVEWDEYTGRLAAVDFVEVRARVGGLIMSMPFQEGAIVDEGDVLVEIDARPYQATLDQARADADQAAAQFELATIEFNRIENIPDTARSKTEIDNAAASLAQAKAVLAAARANVELAQLNVEWCHVRAPITGRVSRRLVTPGNLISGGSGQSTLLTTITSIDPIYCYVDADERSVLKYADLARAGRRVSARQARIPCVMQLSDEEGFPHHGIVDFVDNKVDPMTGTITGRGEFPNPDGWLLPGYFARVRIPGSGRYEAVLVPDASVITDQNQKVLYVVDASSTIRARQIKLGALFGNLRAIESGLSTEDRILINGLMQARPGLKVKVETGTISLESLPAEPDEPAVTPVATQTSQPTITGDGETP